MSAPDALWSFVPVSEYAAPAAPASEAARGRLKRLWRSVVHRTSRPDDDTDLDLETHERLSAEELSTVTPQLDWKQAADALDKSLDEWLDSPAGATPVRTLVGPPGVEVSVILSYLAERRGLSIPPTPTLDSILDGDGEACLGPLQEGGGDLILVPELHRYFLRHEEGLHALRQLVNWLEGEERKSLIACNSWAWEFLCYAVGIGGRLGEPITLAPFGPKRLGYFLMPQLRRHRVKLRQPGERGPAFPDSLPFDDLEALSKSTDFPAWLKMLAARSRGNVAVALALWQACLRRNNGSDPHEGEKQREDDTSDRSSEVYWLLPPSDLQLPHVSGTMDSMHRAILHSILMHGGLSASAIRRLLPFAPHRVQKHVDELRSAGVLVHQDKRLSVALESYPRVRHELDSEGFLVDRC